MEAITIHPESVEQFKTAKVVLKVLKVPFEAQSVNLPDHVSKSIDISLQQYESGQIISLDEFKEKHFRKR